MQQYTGGVETTPLPIDQRSISNPLPDSEAETIIQKSSFVDESDVVEETESESIRLFFSKWSPGLKVQGLYQIVGELARGGMGVIHKAEDLTTGNIVIIKSLLPTLASDVEFKTRFIQEAEAWVKLGVHPNIVRAITVHEIDYLPRIIAEYVEGHSLARRLESGLMPVRDALPIAAQIAWGMQHAHDQDLVHRDLKPGNILLSKDGAVKVTDFGLSKIVPGDVTIQADGYNKASVVVKASSMTAGVVGTPEYIAPEQWEGRSVKASDMYAFGVILFEMFCGRRPFDHSGKPRLSQMSSYHTSHMKETPPVPSRPASDAADTLPAAMVSLIQDCLCKESDGRPSRFHSVAELLNQISTTLFGVMAAERPDDEVLQREDRQAQVHAFLRLARGCILRGNYEKAIELYTSATTMAHGLDDPVILFGIARGLASAYSRLGDEDRYNEYYEECIRQAKLSGDDLLLARGYETHASRLSNESKYDEALAYIEKAQTISIAAGDVNNVGICKNNKGNILRLRGETESAIQCYEEARSIFEMSDNMYAMNRVENSLAIVYHLRGQRDRALALFRKALKFAAAIGDKEAQGWAYNNIGSVLVEHESPQHLQQAERELTFGIKIFESTGNGRGRYSCLINLASCYRVMGHCEKAFEMLQDVLDAVDALSLPMLRAYALQDRAKVNRDVGKLDEAIQDLQEALAFAEDNSISDLIADCKYGLAQIYIQQQRIEEAPSLLREALRLYQISGNLQSQSVQDVLVSLGEEFETP